MNRHFLNNKNKKNVNNNFKWIKIEKKGSHNSDFNFWFEGKVKFKSEQYIIVQNKNTKKEIIVDLESGDHITITNENKKDQLINELEHYIASEYEYIKPEELIILNNRLISLTQQKNKKTFNYIFTKSKSLLYTGNKHGETSLHNLFIPDGFDTIFFDPNGCVVTASYLFPIIRHIAVNNPDIEYIEYIECVNNSFNNELKRALKKNHTKKEC